MRCEDSGWRLGSFLFQLMKSPCGWPECLCSEQMLPGPVMGELRLACLGFWGRNEQCKEEMRHDGSGRRAGRCHASVDMLGSPCAYIGLLKLLIFL